MGINFPPTMMNYQPNPIMGDSFYWPGNNVERNFNPSINPNNSYNFLYGPNDHQAKNIPFIGSHGFKQFPMDKNYGMPEAMKKNDRLVSKQSFNQSKDNNP